MGCWTERERGKVCHLTCCIWEAARTASEDTGQTARSGRVIRVRQAEEGLRTGVLVRLP